MENINQNSQIILASESPRRKFLLENAGLQFTIVPSRVNEEDFCESDPKNHVKILANAKAGDIAKKYPGSWVIGADSIVLINKTVLEKPKSIADARRMLNLLSGNTHMVLTGYAIVCKKQSHFFSDVVTSNVTFKALDYDEMEWYTHTKEPYDKAGGYAVQGLGSFMIKSINGSYTNVVGLPVCEVIDHLYRQGVITRATGTQEKKFQHC
jgi:nucleoside triphosphate pyrophosphatase